MKNILITGHNGYIGTNLCEYLDKSKYNIHGIDKNIGSHAELLTFQGIAKLDTIVHLAALSGITACENNFTDAVIDNISSAFNIFDISRKCKIPVVFLSSQAAKEPKSSIYAMMKSAIEIQAEMLNKKTNANIKVLRITNVYGGIDYLTKKNTVVKQFIEAYRNKKPIVIDGDGTQTRDFIHVDDVCEYILRCIQMGSNVRLNKPIDIGTGEQTSINRLASMFEGGRIKYDTVTRSAGVETNFANINDAVYLFDYKAKNNKLQEYINEMKGIDDNV